MILTDDESLMLQVKGAQRKFAAMAATYFLGVFNDNFFKEAVMLLAVSARKSELQGYATVLFSLPFLLFASSSGWLADRFPKRNVVIGVKGLELVAMICGAIGVYYTNWGLVLVMLFIMGIWAAVFNPSLNGTIPELYPARYVTRANGIIRMVSTTAILAGFALAGVALDVKGISAHGVPLGRLVVAIAVIAISALGVLVSLGVPQRPAASPGARYPWTGPIHTMGELWKIRKDKLLDINISAGVFIWFVGASQIMILNNLGQKQFHMSNSLTSGLIAAEMFGIAAGGMMAGRLSAGPRWHRVLSPAVGIMGLFMIAMMGIPHLPAALQCPALYVNLAIMGMMGGLFMIPVESFIQVRPAPQRKGTVIAAANFAMFGGILLSGPFANLMNQYFEPTSSFALMGVMAVIVSVRLFVALPSRGEFEGASSPGGEM